MIIYYGPSGHRKGLVDAMSAFGVKGPLFKAVIVDNFKYKSALDIFEYMKERFKEDDQKLYFHVPVENTVSQRSEGAKSVPIPGCVKESHHMICFKPDGSILTKVNMCSCEDCLEGNFLDCSSEKGKLVMVGDGTDDYSTDSEAEYEFDEFEDLVDDETELYELRGDTVVEVVKPGNIIALFSPANALELFYLSKVIDSGIAEEDLHDSQNHFIKKGSAYLSVVYYEKKPNSEFSKSGHVIYKQSKINYPVYVLPAQVMSPQIHVTFIGTDIHVEMGEYQWLCDSIGQF